MGEQIEICSLTGTEGRPSSSRVIDHQRQNTGSNVRSKAAGPVPRRDGATELRDHCQRPVT